jgi:CheY-like chemotaxis protein/anti-sigma regulatory factor (Ser/Thr protein kinase)
MDTAANTRGDKPAILVVEDDALLRELLQGALTEDGFLVSCANDGAQALRELENTRFQLMLLDVWLPDMSGLELLAKVAREPNSMRVIVMTSDKAPETLLRAIRERAFDYIAKPFEVADMLELVHNTLASSDVPDIQVLSARPNWVELLVPCDLQAAGRIHGFMSQLAVDLPDDVRDAVSQVFRELLTNAVEWGGKLDAKRNVRVAYLRARRMVQYRIADPGPGFKFEELKHAAINNPEEDPLQHTVIREQQGIRPGGLGIVIIRGLADELLYNERQNEVVFVKYLDK